MDPTPTSPVAVDLNSTQKTKWKKKHERKYIDRRRYMKPGIKNGRLMFNFFHLENIWLSPTYVQIVTHIKSWKIFFFHSPALSWAPDTTTLNQTGINSQYNLICGIVLYVRLNISEHSFSHIKSSNKSSFSFQVADAGQASRTESHAIPWP